MNNLKFKQLVNTREVLTNNGVKTLSNRDEYVDNLLEEESITSIALSLKNFDEIPDELKDDYVFINSFISIIDGLEHAKTLEICKKSITNGEEESNWNKIEEITQTKIDYIKNFANYLYLNN